jgi:hypothetical protein
MPDINLSNLGNNNVAPSVDGGSMTGASRGFKPTGDQGVTSLLNNVLMPAESIQSGDGQILPVIETAKSDGKPVEIDSTGDAESVVKAPTKAENNETQIKLGRTVGDSGYEVAGGADLTSVGVEDPTSRIQQGDVPKVAIPVIPEEAQGSGLFRFFKRLIPHGDAGADQFNLAETVAEKRGLSNPGDTIEEKKQAA